MANFVTTKNASKHINMTSRSKCLARIPLKPILSLKKWSTGKKAGGQVALFAIQIIALEAVRRLSKAKCPLAWNGLQALQVLCYPPLRWIARWAPFGVVIKGMQMLSRPLLVLSIVNVFSDPSIRNSFQFDDTDNSRSGDDSQLSSESHSDPPSTQGACESSHQAVQPTDRMHQLSLELETLGIILPERINKRELQRFYVSANGDLSTFISCVKRTIRWRETYRILSVDELEVWSHMIFWHGLDTVGRPCLIVRLGMVTSLPSQDRPSFVQAVVSQVEYGILQLVDVEDPQITVLVDCLGLSSLKFPMKMLRYCSNILQDNFPNVLGCLIVIRLPPVVRVIAQTFIKVLKPVTKQKLRIEGALYKNVLNESFQMLPSYLGGACTCTRCVKGTIKEFHTSTPTNGLITDFSCNFSLESLTPQLDDMIMDYDCSRVLRTAVVGILIVFLLFAFIEGLYNP